MGGQRGVLPGRASDRGSQLEGLPRHGFAGPRASRRLPGMAMLVPGPPCQLGNLRVRVSAHGRITNTWAHGMACKSTAMLCCLHRPCSSAPRFSCRPTHAQSRTPHTSRTPHQVWSSSPFDHTRTRAHTHMHDTLPRHTHKHPTQEHPHTLDHSILLPLTSMVFLASTALSDPGIIPRREPDDDYLAGRKPRCACCLVSTERVHALC